MSDANQQGKTVEVAVCICQMTINKEKVFKLRYVYVRRQSTRKKGYSCGMYMSVVNQKGKIVRVAVCICQMSINKEKMVKLRYVYV